MLYLISLLALTALALLFIVVSTYRLKAPPMPSSPDVREALLKVTAKYTDNGGIADLGSGWGGLARKTSSIFSESRIYGVEGSLFPFLFSRVLEVFRKEKNITFLYGNFFKPGFLKKLVKNTNVFFCYLSPLHMVRLKELFTIFEEYGSMHKYIISIVFAFPGLTPVEIVEVKDKLNSRIFVYKLNRYI